VVSRSITLVSAAVSAAALLSLAGCRTAGARRAAVIGEAYAGPAILNIHRDISPRSPVTASVKHGERVAILQQRRIFYRVRTASGAEGWTFGNQLLGSADMAALKELAARAAKLPAQGSGICYDVLNVHTLPSTRSPSFAQLKAKESFTVVAHVLVPRVDLPRSPLIPPTPKKDPTLAPVKKTSSRLGPPPMPKGPPLPANWLELSKPDLDPAELAAEQQAQQAPPPQEDDWSLIRTASGQTGWVLTRRVSMAIPDEVAQYAEGRRIVSYFSLGTLQDGDAQKHIWLWTTVGEGHHPYDFDSFRVFIWSLRRHRYETAYIERNITGHAPVLLDQMDYTGAGRSKGDPAKYPGFSICMQQADGSLVRRNYVLLTNIIRFAGEEACQVPPPVYTVPVEDGNAAPAAESPVAAPEQPENRSLVERLKARLHGLLHKGH